MGYGQSTKLSSSRLPGQTPQNAHSWPWLRVRHIAIPQSSQRYPDSLCHQPSELFIILIQRPFCNQPNGNVRACHRLRRLPQYAENDPRHLSPLRPVFRWSESFRLDALDLVVGIEHQKSCVQRLEVQDHLPEFGLGRFDVAGQFGTFLNQRSDNVRLSHCIYTWQKEMIMRIPKPTKLPKRPKPVFRPISQPVPIIRAPEAQPLMFAY